MAVVTSGQLAVIAIVGHFVKLVLGKLQAGNGSGTLLTDVPNNIGNGIGLVTEMTVRDIGHAECRDALVLAGLHHIFLDLWNGLLLSLTICGARWDLVVLFLLDIFRSVRVALTDILRKLWCIAQRTNNVLHMVGLAIDEAAEVNDNTLSFVALTREVGVCVLEL